MFLVTLTVRGIVTYQTECHDRSIAQAHARDILASVSWTDDPEVTIRRLPAPAPRAGRHVTRSRVSGRFQTARARLREALTIGAGRPSVRRA